LNALDRLLKDATAGDPITGLKWTRKTCRKLANELKRKGFQVEHSTIPRLARLLGCKRAYLLWRANPAHPSLRFKKVHSTLPIYSARVDLDWRAVGVLKEGTLVWFWVGSHQQYEALLGSF